MKKIIINLRFYAWYFWVRMIDIHFGEHGIESWWKFRSNVERIYWTPICKVIGHDYIPVYYIEDWSWEMVCKRCGKVRE